MVTAIVVPIICLYFFWLTRKEMKEQKAKWLALDNVPEESTNIGTIKTIQIEKQRYYYHYFIQVINISLKTEYKTIKAKKISPLTKNVEPFPYHVGEQIRVFGKWEENYLLIKRVQKIKDESRC